MALETTILMIAYTEARCQTETTLVVSDLWLIISPSTSDLPSIMIQQVRETRSEKPVQRNQVRESRSEKAGRRNQVREMRSEKRGRRNQVRETRSEKPGRRNQVG